MNASNNFTVSPTLLQKIVDKSLAAMQTKALNQIDAEVDSIYADQFSKLDQLFGEYDDPTVQRLHEEYEQLAGYWAYHKELAAFAVGFLIGQNLPLVSLPETEQSAR